MPIYWIKETSIAVTTIAVSPLCTRVHDDVGTGAAEAVEDHGLYVAELTLLYSINPEALA